MSQSPTLADKARASTGILVLEDGTSFLGIGCGAVGMATGEVCFNTSMSGYQEVLTDPSYASQIIAFTFPHIGIVGCNADDMEASATVARGAVFRAELTEPSNWRSERSLDSWLAAQGLVTVSGIDTRFLTFRIRDDGALAGVIAHDPSGAFDVEALADKARAWGGIEGADLATEITCKAPYRWQEGLQPGSILRGGIPIVAVDYGIKRNILRLLVERGFAPTVVPAGESAEAILARKPAGVFLSNGPGDPAATARHAAPTIRRIVDEGLPVFGICLGHQLLALALGATTEKMHHGHRGANQPVLERATGKVEITSQNHGFIVKRETLPPEVEETHSSLFDGSIEGLQLRERPVFGVQYHPEASPGPRDSAYLFDRFRVAVAGGEADT